MRFLCISTYAIPKECEVKIGNSYDGWDEGGERYFIMCKRGHCCLGSLKIAKNFVPLDEHRNKKLEELGSI